ncbi:MAG: DUF89 family protein [Thermoguttaceae bacterium]|nr:DUF89 family protein [Thermoguttaceae bacterium]
MLMRKLCFSCLFRQAVDAAWLLTEDQAKREAILRGMGRLMAETDFERTPPEIGREMHAMIREVLQDPDPYLEIKREINAITKSILPQLRQRVESSSNPLETAIRYAIAGNVIDFATFQSISADEIIKTVDEAANRPINGLDSADFEAELRREDVKTLLYVCDNCGEVVWDALLVEQLQKYVSVTVAVRGGAVVNDALLEDAEFAGLTALCPVITTGCDVPGAPDSAVSEEFREVFLRSDLVIAKGQGNYETMQPSARPVIHLFMVKCPVIQNLLGLPKGTLVFRKE